jgi:hypothetical protein
MKEYKGWEIAKMICEGDLKEEDLIQNEYGDIFEIKNHHLVYCESDKELGSSYFGGDFNYTILQKPVDFMEAWEAYKKGKTIKSLETKNRYMRAYNGIMININSQGRWLNDVVGIGYKEMEGLWLIQEEIEDVEEL